MYITVMHADGSNRTVAEAVGSQHEQKYYRVMTETHGKLFFDSKQQYAQWNTRGRRVYDARQRDESAGHDDTPHVCT